MPFDLANAIFDLLKTFYVNKDFYWRNGSKANAQSGCQAKKILSTPNKNDEWKSKKMISLEKESIQQQNRLNDMMKQMFKSGQIRYVTALLKDMYQCSNDSEQQLYYLLSFPFCTKKIFLKLARQWKQWKLEHPGGNIDEYFCVSYFHLKKCGELGTLNRRELRAKKMYRANGQRLRVSEICDQFDFEKVDFVNMEVPDNEIPFTEFPESGMRFCTDDIKDAIEKIFKSSWFTRRQVLDLSPKSLFFICVSAESIPKMKFGFMNFPFWHRIAEILYPKVWKAWRENQIEEMVFMGMNNWTSTETHKKSPDWWKKEWPAMEPYGDYIEVKYTPQGLNFKNGITGEMMNGLGYTCCVVHCKRHPIFKKST